MKRLMRSRRKFIDRLAVFKINNMVLLQPKSGYVFTDSTRLLPANNTDFVGGLIATTGSNYATQATAANKPQLKVTAAGNNYLDFDGLNDQLNFNTPIPNGAWFADMQNINYLKNSHTATTNTIVDHLGNTVTLNTGEIGWNNTRRVRNLLANSGLPNGLADLQSSNQVTLGSLTGFANAIVFGNNSVQRWAYKQALATAGRDYLFSIIVRMDDGSAPKPSSTTGSETNDFSAVISGALSTFVGLKNLGNNLYACHFLSVNNGAASPNHGIIKYGGQSAKGFKISGYQLIDITNDTNKNPVDYIDSNVVYNAGIVGVKFFDTYNNNTLSSGIVTGGESAKLPTPPTIKVNAGDNISIAGDLYALAYAPTIPSESDRLKIEKYVQDAKL